MKLDEHFMELAIALGEEARGISPPNPWVGCVIVKDGHIVGSGNTHKSGGNHAEINALNEAADHAIGATLYVTLEPCSHFGKTPPCVDAIIKAKIAKVVIALTDPDKKVCGQGVAKLKNAGIDVVVGVCKEEAFNSLESYLYQRVNSKPFVVAKAALSIDGRTAPFSGTSQWISSEKARENAHQLRFQSQAILVGSGTALMDQPTLNVRGQARDMLLNQPLRVLFDARGKVPATGPLFDLSIAKTLVFTSKDCKEGVIEAWKMAGAEVEVIKTCCQEKLDIEEALLILGKRNIIQLLVEGGSTLQASFLKNQAINRLVLYIGPVILGDSGTPLFKDFFVNSLKDAPRLKLLDTKQIDDCIRLDYKILQDE